MGKTSIEWTDETWNPVVGCTRVSEGCRFCYAFEIHDMRHAAHKAGKAVPAQYAKPFKEVQLLPERLEQPYHWRKPRQVFVNSMSDLFHPAVPFEFIARVFTTMMGSPKHTFQILTKRPERAAGFLGRCGSWEGYVTHNGEPPVSYGGTGIIVGPGADNRWPLSNVWLGTSVEDQEHADKRIPYLLRCPAAVRFLSCEPLLGPITFRIGQLDCQDCEHNRNGGTIDRTPEPCDGNCPQIKWVIVGGESGDHARPMHPDWARSICNQCQSAGVPFFFKQWGEWKPISEMPETEYEPLYEPASKSNPVVARRCRVATRGLQFDGREGFHQVDEHIAYQIFRVGKKKAGRQLDGREWSEFPTVACATV